VGLADRQLLNSDPNLPSHNSSVCPSDCLDLDRLRGQLVASTDQNGQLQFAMQKLACQRTVSSSATSSEFISSILQSWWGL
jgi:hypothetical protein